MSENKEGLDGHETEPGAVVTNDNGAMATRRRFAQGAAGAAVVLSLGNRAAWGQQDTLCISAQVWTSYNAPGNLSFDPARHPDDDVFAFESYEGVEVPGSDIPGENPDDICKVPPPP